MLSCELVAGNMIQKLPLVVNTPTHLVNIKIQGLPHIIAR